MPELPEVEVTRRSFVAAIEGAQILAATMGKPLRWPLGCPVQQLVGRRIRTIHRRGKYLLTELDQGWLLLHLGMSGRLCFGTDLPPMGRHDHFDLLTSQGRLRLHDPRRFGAVVHVPDLAAPLAIKLLARLGMEPLEPAFELGLFAQGLKKRRSAIKQVLLAGDLVTGVGNIYASEALFIAAIRPDKAANTLGPSRVARLHAAIRQVLQQALEQGGSTLRDFASGDGKTGYFQLQAMVYGRAGQPCKRCNSSIELMRLGQRSSFYCPRCQKS